MKLIKCVLAAVLIALMLTGVMSVPADAEETGLMPGGGTEPHAGSGGPGFYTMCVVTALWILAILLWLIHSPR